jgi:hypothetical protein
MGKMVKVGKVSLSRRVFCLRRFSRGRVYTGRVIWGFYFFELGAIFSLKKVRNIRPNLLPAGYYGRLSANQLYANMAKSLKSTTQS